MSNAKSREELILNEQLFAKRKEAELHNSPSTFVKWAKLSREANKIESNMVKLSENRIKNYQSQSKLRKCVEYSTMAVLLIAYFFQDRFCNDDDGLITFESHLLAPFSRILSFGLSPQITLDTISLSPFGWVIVCQRVIRMMF